MPDTHPKCSAVATEDEEWASLMHIIKDNRSELDNDNASTSD